MAAYPPPSPKAGHPVQGACQTTSVPIPAASALPGAATGGGLLARDTGVSPPGHMQGGLKPTLTQREEQGEAGEEQGGLREPGFRAHFDGLLCVERTWCWCGLWRWWRCFFERPGYLQVT